MHPPVPLSGPLSITGGLEKDELLDDDIVYSKLLEIDSYYKYLNTQLLQHRKRHLSRLQTSVSSYELKGLTSQATFNFITKTHENLQMSKRQQQQLLNAAIRAKLDLTTCKSHAESKNSFKQGRKRSNTKESSRLSSLFPSKRPRFFDSKYISNINSKADVISEVKSLLTDTATTVGNSFSSLMTLVSSLDSTHLIQKTKHNIQLITVALSANKEFHQKTSEFLDTSFEIFILDLLMDTIHQNLRTCLKWVFKSKINCLLLKFKKLLAKFKSNMDILGVPKEMQFVFKSNNHTFDELFPLAKESLIEIKDISSIAGKIAQFSAAFTYLQKEVNSYCSTSGCSSIPLTTDHLLSLFCFLLVYLQDVDLIVDVWIIDELLPDELACSEAGFTVVTCTAGLNYLESLNFERDFLEIDWLNFGSFADEISDYLHQL
ncbi:hypothetical protein P9112_014009 [Eukaryota sp. TZLM1-RC]